MRAYILIHQAGLADPAVTKDDDLLIVSQSISFRLRKTVPSKEPSFVMP